jgi:hypothetical protein
MRPVRPPEGPEPNPYVDPWASEPVVEAVGSVPMASVPMAFVRMPLVPMPATVGVPWQGADAEQHRQQDEDSHPLRSCSHGHHLSGSTRSIPFEGVYAAVSKYCTHNLPGVTMLAAPWPAEAAKGEEPGCGDAGCPFPP